MKNQDIITKDFFVGELIRKYPDVCKILEKFGMDCKDCMLAPTSTIEKAAKMHNVSLNVLLKEINKYIRQKDK